MSARGIFLLGTALAALCLRAEEPASAPVAAAPAKPVGVYVIPVREEIADPVLYVVRRGLKEATEKGIENVVIDMDTPGGSGATMLEIMEALDKFPGTKITYVNNEAISAGAIIASVSDEIYFAPKGVMGAADVIQSNGEDLPATLKKKVDSYIGAKIESYSKKTPRRAEVIKAMRVSDFELSLDGKVIKPKGELLTLTAEKAIALYGDPPTPLLASGIADNLDSLLDSKFGAGNYTVTKLEVTWSEYLAQYLNKVSPILLGLGILALFIEFKTPGFGVFGISGIILLGVVFLSSSVAGLAGHEPVIVFGIGLLLILAEVFFFPGVMLPGILGFVMLFGSLVWALTDIWPGEPVTFTADTFLGPIGDVMFGVVIAVVGAVILARILPKGMLWDKLVLQAAVASSSGNDAVALEPQTVDELIGKHGRAVTDLFPSGEVEVAGKRYAAQLELGTAEKGEEVVVTRRSSFGLQVEKPRK